MKQIENLQGPPISVDIPPGYHEIPFDNMQETLTQSVPVLTESMPPEFADSIPQVVGTLGFLMSVLANNHVLYCGIGLHRSETAADAVASWLTISSLNFGEAQNPRLVIRDLISAKTKADFGGVLEAVDIAGRPVLFAEWTKTFPAPDIPYEDRSTGDSSIYQIEATVPSDDGTAIAVIEFSTSSRVHGPEFRPMVFGMAASVQFGEVPAELGSLRIVG